MANSKKKSTTNSLELISIVTPFYNEEEVVNVFFNELNNIVRNININIEFICIDDGSVDNTYIKLCNIAKKQKNVKIIRFSKNFGKECALSAGLDYAKGDAVIVIDSDLQDQPSIIPQMIEKWRLGYKVVYGIRKEREQDSFLKKNSAKLFYKIYNLVCDTKIPGNVGDFRLLDRQVVDVLKNIKEKKRFMKGVFEWVGFSHCGVEFVRQNRIKGGTKWNYWRLWNFAIDGITSFSTIPLRIWSYVGFIIALIAFIYGSFLTIRTIFSGIDVPGYASIMVAILFLGGMQLLSLGIIGEYIGRIYTETKNRPLYVVSEIFDTLN